MQERLVVKAKEASGIVQNLIVVQAYHHQVSKMEAVRSQGRFRYVIG